MGNIGIIILNYNNFEDTFNCIKSIEKYNTANIKIIVVDNGSTREGTTKEICNYIKENFNNNFLILKDNEYFTTPLPYITFLVSNSNDGYAQGNNKGLNLAFQDDSIDNILIINNDVLFVEDILPKMAKLQADLPSCGLISPVLYKKDGIEYDYNCARLCESNWEIIIKFLFWYRNPFNILARKKEKRLLLKRKNLLKNNYLEVETPSGSCMLAKKTLWKDLSGFDPKTFLYYEENILYKRLKALGLRNYVILQTKCIHLGACSTSKHGKGSYKMSRIKIDSTDYYLKHYGEMNQLQKFIYPLAKGSIEIKLLLLKLIG